MQAVALRVRAGLKQDELMWNRSIFCRHRPRKRAIQ